jgi:hypothetical protein
MAIVADLARIVAYLLSWLVVWLNQLADAIEYRQQTMQCIQEEPKPIPVPVKW